MREGVRRRVLDGDVGTSVGEFVDRHGIGLLRVATVVFVLLWWEVAANVFSGTLGSVFVPLESIVAAAYQILASGDVVYHGSVTARSIGIAFVIAAVFGIAFGAVMGTSEYLADGIEPIIYYVSTVPKIVYYPLLLMAFGVGPSSQIAKGVLSAFFPIVILVTAGVVTIDPQHKAVARLYDASLLETFQKVYLPSTVLHIITGFRLGIGTAIISVILAELYVSKAGLGNLLGSYFAQFQMRRVYALLLLIFAAAYAINMALMRVEGYLAARGYGSDDQESTGFGF